MKKLTTICLATVAALSLAACSNKGKQTTDTPQNKNSKEISLMMPEWGIPTKKMLNQFKQETGITVKTMPTSWNDVKSKVAIASASQKAPADVFEVDWSWVGEFAHAGWLQPLHDTPTMNQQMPSLSYFKVDHHLYAMPYANDMRLAYINTAMLQKAGITKMPTSWPELFKVFDQLKAKHIVKYPWIYPMAAEESATTSFINLDYTRNKIVFNQDNTLNKKAALDTFKLLKSALNKGYINPADASIPGADAYRAINNKQAAYLIGPTSYLASSNDPKTSKAVGEIKNIPMPGKTGPAHATVAFVEAVGISKYSPNKAAAEKFIKWYNSKQTQLELNKTIHVTPTRTAALEQLVKEDKLPKTSVVLAGNSEVKNPFPHGVPKYYTKMSSEMFNVINNFAKGKLSPQQATDQMAQKVDALAKSND